MTNRALGPDLLQHGVQEGKTENLTTESDEIILVNSTDMATHAHSMRGSSRTLEQARETTGKPLAIKTSVAAKKYQAMAKLDHGNRTKSRRARTGVPSWRMIDKGAISSNRKLQENVLELQITKSNSKASPEIKASSLKPLSIHAALFGLGSVMAAVVLVGLLRYLVKHLEASEHLLDVYPETRISSKQRLVRQSLSRKRKNSCDRMWLCSMSTIMELEEENLVDTTNSSSSDSSENRELLGNHQHPTARIQELCVRETEHSNQTSSLSTAPDDSQDERNAHRELTEAAMGEETLNIGQSCPEPWFSNHLNNECSSSSSSNMSTVERTIEQLDAQVTSARYSEPSTLPLLSTNCKRNEYARASRKLTSTSRESNNQTRYIHKTSTRASTPRSEDTEVQNIRDQVDTAHLSHQTLEGRSPAQTARFLSHGSVGTPEHSCLETASSFNHRSSPQNARSNSQNRRRHQERRRVQAHLFRQSLPTSHPNSSESGSSGSIYRTGLSLTNNRADRLLSRGPHDSGAMMPISALPSTFLGRTPQQWQTEAQRSVQTLASSESSSAAATPANEDVQQGKVLVQQLSNGAQLIYIPAPHLPEYGEDKPPPYHQ